jgi:hypothetical protein
MRIVWERCVTKKSIEREIASKHKWDVCPNDHALRQMRETNGSCYYYYYGPMANALGCVIRSISMYWTSTIWTVQMSYLWYRKRLIANLLNLTSTISSNWSEISKVIVKSTWFQKGTPPYDEAVLS